MKKKYTNTSATKSYTPAYLTREHPKSCAALCPQQKLPPDGSSGCCSPGLAVWLSNTQGSAAALQSLGSRQREQVSTLPKLTSQF